MRILLLDFLLSVVIVLAIGSATAEILYEPHPKSHRPDISKPRIYIDHQGRAWEVREGTFRPDRGKPLVGAPKPVEPPKWPHNGQ